MKSSSDTSLSGKSGGQERNFGSHTQQLTDYMKHSTQGGALLEMVYFKHIQTKIDPSPRAVYGESGNGVFSFQTANVSLYLTRGIKSFLSSEE